jgi:ubiquinone/menaquinone biosynthesis C-methylase UbiE
MAEDLKAQVHDFWQSNPCGAKFTRAEPGTREFFDAIEKHRYETESHIPEVVDFEQWRGKDVLEVGCGIRTDAVMFARAGSRYTGVDLTERSIELVQDRFELEGLDGRLRVGDAEALPFADSTFDLFYSHGVLHHTPDTARAISEAYRVLRLGGQAMVMLYHRNSYNYYVNIMTLRRLGAGLLGFNWGPAVVSKLTGESQERLTQLRDMYRQDPAGFLSTQQFLNNNTDGPGNPLARVFSRREAARLFSEFKTVRTETHFLNKRWIPLIGGLLPRSIEKSLASAMGWHLWTLAVK